MLELLTEKFSKSLERLKSSKRLNEKQLKDIVRDIRTALLDADVDYDVVKSFTKRITERALKEDINRSNLSPSDMVLMTVYEELTNVLGGQKSELKKGIVLFVGLQGTGKTTTIGKIASLLSKENHKVAVTSTDVRRPAAMLQLQKLAERVGVDYLNFGENLSALEIAKKAKEKAKDYDYLLLDTAGRLHIDEELMQELKQIKELVRPSEVIYVADAMQGQEALNVAKTFNSELGLTGAVLTKMDGDARGGLALSIKEALGVNIKFIGVGEKIEDIEPFYPDRIAQRILGLGDIQSLVEKAQEAIPEDEAQVLATKIMAGEFSLEDMLKQIRFIKNMGPLEKVLQMIPGLGAQLKNVKIDEKKFKKTEAIILSMTREERRNPKIINLSRKQRIAKGSGTTVSDVNKVLKDYEEMKKMIKKLKGSLGFGGFPKLPFRF